MENKKIKKLKNQYERMIERFITSSDSLDRKAREALIKGLQGETEADIISHLRKQIKPNTESYYSDRTTGRDQFRLLDKRLETRQSILNYEQTKRGGKASKAVINNMGSSQESSTNPHTSSMTSGRLNPPNR